LGQPGKAYREVEDLYKLMEAENILVSKLNEFTRKYYKNSIIRGGLISLGILVSLFLIEVLLEYFSYFPTPARIVLLYFYLAVSVASLGILVVIPLLKYLRIGTTMTHEQAAAIIGRHFSEIGDKLLNTLQLIDLKSASAENQELLLASIEQKIRNIRPIPFTRVIDLKKNSRYLKYALPPLLVLTLILMISPSMVSEPTLRLIRYTRKFEPPSLFRILILNRELKAMQQDDFTLRVEMRGEAIPEEIFLKNGSSTFPMKREKASVYSYTFRSLQSNTVFSLIAGDKEFEEHTLQVFPKPLILNFEAKLDYPLYTGKQSETLNDIGDFVIPEGTVISWNVYTRDVSGVKFRMPEGEIRLEKHNSNVFRYSRRFVESSTYSVSQENEYSSKSDSLSYVITVVKDAFPEISLSEANDTATTGKLFFQGTIKDDYGFSSMQFVISGKREADTVAKVIKTESITIDRKTSSQVYFYSLDLGSLDIKPGDTYSYYFEIWDNDGVNGPKSTRTVAMTFAVPGIEQLAESTDKNSENIRKELNESLDETKDIGKTLDELNRKMIDQDEVTWKEKRKLEDVIRANEKIQKQVADFKAKNEENIRNEKQYLETSERILEKQKKLNELASQLMTEEMKKLVQDMKNLLNQMDKNKLNDLLPKMKKMNQDLEKELDRNLQLFKQIEMERKLEQTTADLNKLADKQEELSKRTEGLNKPEEKTAMEQQEIKQKFDSVNKSLDDLQKMGQELENSPDLKQTEDERKSIEDQLNKSDEMMKNGKMKDASKNQKNTSDKMKDLAKQLEEMQQDAEEEAQEQDAGALKLLLQNLNQLSFQQEDLIYRTMNINRNDPKYLQLVEDQKQIKDKFKSIEDTLNKIARREVMLKSIIMKEVSAVNENLEYSEKTLSDRVLPTAMARQQYAMTGMNNLSNLLAEVLKQMNEQLDNSRQSNGQKSCKKPGKPGGKKSMNTLRQMQEEMSSKLQKLKDSQSKSKDGKSQSRSEEEGTSREIAKMVSEQEAIRQALREYENALKEQGMKDNGNINSLIEEMEKNEKDILNKRIDQETFNRQQRIVTRMLESEKAEQKREKEEKRESTEAKNHAPSNPAAILEYKKNKSTGQDLINFTPVPVNYYYRNKASEYILKIGK